MQVLLKCCYAQMELHIGKTETFFCKVSFLRRPHCQFGGVGQDMKQTYLYHRYALFQEQWDRCNEHNYQTYNYLVKRHHMYSRT